MRGTGGGVGARSGSSSERAGVRNHAMRSPYVRCDVIIGTVITIIHLPCLFHCIDVKTDLSFLPLSLLSLPFRVCTVAPMLKLIYPSSPSLSVSVSLPLLCPVLWSCTYILYILIS